MYDSIQSDNAKQTLSLAHIDIHEHPQEKTKANTRPL